jgi:3-oxo-5alpha-steroid 4-dehydrogenase
VRNAADAPRWHEEAEVVVVGLGAAGASASGLAGRGYNSGISLSDATFFGRRAGAQAARGAPD